MRTVGGSDKGKLRVRNEDSFRFGSFDDGTTWGIVCDGMGGVHGVMLASNIAINTVSDKVELCYTHTMPVKSLENLLLSAITTANVTVFDRGIYDNSLKGMGTTIVAAVIKDSTACIAHVGDSRAYKISNNGIVQITKDHSLVQEMLDNGQITVGHLQNLYNAGCRTDLVHIVGSRSLNLAIALQHRTKHTLIGIHAAHQSDTLLTSNRNGGNRSGEEYRTA